MTSANNKRGENTSIQFAASCTIPKLVTYNMLSKKIKEIDIGNIYPVEEQFSAFIEDENVNNCYRDLREYLPRLATFYFSMKIKQKEALNHEKSIWSMLDGQSKRCLDRLSLQTCLDSAQNIPRCYRKVLDQKKFSRIQ